MVSQDESKWERARFEFELANQARIFEIELFWKRANYFWLFVAAVIAAYGLMWTFSEVGPAQIRMIFAALGLVASFSWWLVNRGSKWWFERWESKVQELEAQVTDKKLYRADAFDAEKKRRLGSARFSVSQIAIDLGLVVAVSWLVVLGLEASVFSQSMQHTIGAAATILISILLCAAIYRRARRTSEGKPY